MSDYPFAALVQFGFVPFAMFVFARTSIAKACALVVIGGLLFLPDVTLLSLGSAVAIEKDRVIYLAAILGLVINHRKAFAEARPILTLAIIIGVMFAINLACWSANTQSVVDHGEIQPGLSFAWVLGQTIDDFFRFALPFLIGKVAFRSAGDLRVVLYCLVGFGVIYTVLILIELVMAIPFRVFQLSDYIYGLRFRPTFRYGLTEPIVFLGLGHTLATFMVMTVIAAAAFKKIDKNMRWGFFRPFRGWNLIGLLATLKVGATILGLGALAIFSMFRVHRAALLAYLFALGICIYPVLQVYGLFPEDVLVGVVEDFDDKRARSLNGRFDEEEFVLEQIGERLMVGWGHFARIPGASFAGFGTGETGLDAWWVIRLGMSGLLGVIAAFLVCAIPVFRARRMLRSVDSIEVQWLVVATMLCIVVRMADLLLNGWWNSLPVFMAGALYGACANLRSTESASATDSAYSQGRKSQPRYAGPG